MDPIKVTIETIGGGNQFKYELVDEHGKLQGYNENITYTTRDEAYKAGEQHIAEFPDEYTL